MQCALCNLNNNVFMTCHCGKSNFCNKCIDNNKCYNCGLDIKNITINDYIEKLTNHKNNLINEHKECVNFTKCLGLNIEYDNNHTFSNILIKYNKYVNLIKNGKYDFSNM